MNAKQSNLFPLTPYERGMYLEQMMNKGSTSYNLNLTVTIEGASGESVRKALQTLYAAHEAFHSYYGEADGVPVRILTDALPEIREKTAATKEEVMAAVDGSDTPFDLCAGVPVRTTLYKLPDATVILHLAIHHIAFDGGSAKPFADELFALLNGRTPQAAQVDLSAVCGAACESNEKGLAFFREMFADGVPVNEMPLRGKRPPTHPLSDKALSFDFDSKQVAALDTIAKRYGVTKFQLIFAALSMVLGKYCGSEDIVIGIPTNMRTEEAKQVIGMFVNTAPVRVKPVREAGLNDFLSEVRQAVRGATRGASLPFEEVVREFDRSRDESRHPVFDVSLNYYRLPPVYRENGITMALRPPLQKMNRDLSFTVRCREEGMQVIVQYASALFEDEMVERITEQLRYTLNRMGDRGVTTVRDALQLPDAQLQKLTDLSAEATAEIAVPLLHRQFEKAAAEHADATALIAADKTLTFRKLNESANIIAHNLMERGIRRGDSVALLLPRKSGYFACLLGVLKAGAAFIPCDPQYPADRINHIIDDSGASCVVTTADRLSDFPADKALDAAELQRGEKTGNPAVEMDGGDLAYMIYTSGSTGKPKGVMLTHKGICSFCQNHPANILYDTMAKGISTMLAVTTVSFDLSLKDTLGVLCNGKTVVFADEDEMNNPRELARLMETHHVDAINATPSRYLQYFIYQPFADALKQCRLVMAGGEPFPEKLLKQLQAMGIEHIINTYGPTECTVSSNMARLTNAETVTVGRPLLNYTEYIVDQYGDLAPFGVAGELYIGGAGVARGYRNLPEQTEARFITYRQERVYRSGDCAKFDRDGNVVILGRLDGQIKLRGLRIELGEIENVIQSYGSIKEAAIAVKTIGGVEHLAAYFAADSLIDVRALREFAASKLTHYMVPTAYMQLEEVPHTLNGKKDYKNLPEPVITSERAGSAAPAELNVLEKILKDMVAEIIGTDAFGVTDLLVDWGLTSLTGIRLAMSVYEKFNVEINARRLVSDATVQSIENEILTALLSRAEKRGTPAAAAAASPQSCALSFAQQGVFAECQANPDTVQYNIPYALSFPDGIGTEQLQQAVRSVIDAHPYILCHFTANEDGEIVQEPIPDCRVEIPVREMTEAEYEAYKAAFVRPFDLMTGPCVRFEMIKTDTLHLLMEMHHLVSDGASMDLFFRQLTEALDGKAPEKETYTYYDFVAQEKPDAETEDFFRTQMAEVEEPTQLIPDVFDENLPHTEKTVAVPTNIAAVRAFAQKIGVTPAAVYLAACFITYGRFVCEDTVSIVTVSNGRSNMKVRNTMGMFVNTLPLVTTLDHKEDTLSFLRRVSRTFSDTIAHENYPFARIASTYDFRPCASYTYQIGVMTTYQTRYGAITFEPLQLDIAKLPVAVYIRGDEENAVIRADYDSSLYSEAMMQGLVESIDNVVRGLMTSENVSAISLTSEKQWKVLDIFNKPWDLDYDRSDSVLTRFKKIAAELPDKTAIVFQDISYTYRELDELTDRLAAKIYQLASEVTGKTHLAEEVVAIILPRNEQTMILPLAAVKAGLGYEPLDPSYPPDRLNFMVKDADVCMLLADDALADVVNEFTGRVVTVSELYAMDTPDVHIETPKPEDLFIMLYTSGSTGAPKGCQIENGNIVAYAHGMRHTFYTRDDNVAAYASFSFDVNMADVFCTLLVGGTVHLVPEEVRMNLDRLAEFFDASEITTLLLTTQVGVQFLQNYPKLKTLRLLVMGGEKLPAVEPSGISYTIANGYGPTENCCGVSIFPIREWEPNIPIGKPIATIHGYVLDKTNHRLPAGAAGEYCLSGPQVSRGYLNRPDKTAEAYQQSPFDPFRMYHTGDIVRYRQSGDIEFVGRKDGQVKIRGFRIETKEVEAVIRGYEGIRDVTVQAYDFESGGKYLAAFVVGDEAIDIQKLTAYVKSRKPAYMVPSVMMQIDKIPLTVNQKVDKKALPKPAHQKAAYVAPAGKIEEDFCGIFSHILGVERVSAEDDFFEIGGSSILAMKVVIAAEKAGYQIVYNDVFSYTTPRMMAEFLGETHEEAAPQPSAPESYAPWTPPVTDQNGYDYSRIHELLRRNTMDAFRGGTRNTLGDVLLLGGTGYLGSHVLHELIAQGEHHIFCFVRPGNQESGESRLKATLAYYFGNDYADLFGTRISVIEGDATDASALSSFAAPHSGMTVINCAASVKHFAKGNEIERANVDSVKNLTAWCERSDARLMHISTGSIMGSRAGNVPPTTYRFTEHVLYAGQITENAQYNHSKFMAERHIYEEMLTNGLKAKVCRVGNLAPRESDGEFQKNYRTNNYMNSLKAFHAVGKISYDALTGHTEFSPIDALAKAILKLCETPDECVCFMPINPHRPLMGDVIRVMNAMGYRIEGAEPEAFAEALRQVLADESRSSLVNSLIAYQSGGNVQRIGLDSMDNSYTMRVLERLGFHWPETGAAYMRRFLEKLTEKGFFDSSEQER